jgi:hypothetical protein
MPIPARALHSSRVAIKPALVVKTWALRVAGVCGHPVLLTTSPLTYACVYVRAVSRLLAWLLDGPSNAAKPWEGSCSSGEQVRHDAGEQHPKRAKPPQPAAGSCRATGQLAG